MRTINETFTDEEFEAMERAKGDKTWHNFLMQLGQVELDIMKTNDTRAKWRYLISIIRKNTFTKDQLCETLENQGWTEEEITSLIDQGLRVGEFYETEDGTFKSVPS